MRLGLDLIIVGDNLVRYLHMWEDAHVKSCPNKCGGVGLLDSSILLPEGPLRQCPECGQLVSHCSLETYCSSNSEWDIEEGTWPSEKDLTRLIKRRARDFNCVSKILGKQFSDIRLLDVGCSNGASLWIASRFGVEAEGVEVSLKAARNGIDRGFTIHLGYLAELGLPANSFDVITLYEVIEHLDSPMDLLIECQRLLKPGGVLVVGTGNTDSWTKKFMGNRWDFFDLRQHGGHISFFCAGSLNVLASRTGFTLKKVRTSSVKFFDKGDCSYVLYRLTKCVSELLNMPSRMFGKGHQMEAYLVSQKNADAVQL